MLDGKEVIIMGFPDISTIDFSNINVVSIPKKLKDIAELYRARNFAEADRLLEAFKKLPRQKAAIEAQLAFFNCDFVSAIERIMEYYPYLGEWYTGNMWYQTSMALSFALIRAKSEPIAKDCKEYLKTLYDSLSEEQLENKGLRYLTFIPQILDRADGKFNSTQQYTPPENPKSYDELFDGYAQYHKKQLAKLDCPPEEDTRTASDLLILIDSSGSTEDFLRLYEKHCKSPELRDWAHLKAARIYMYLGKNDRAAEALLDFATLGWRPLQITDIMPFAMLDADDLFPLITDEMLKFVYNEPMKM